MRLVVALALALVWPDVPDRVEKNLASQDLAARRAAASEIRTLPRARGGALAKRALADPDVEVRVLAAQSAVRLRVEGATELVLPWLGERDARLRIAACEVARAMPVPRAVAQLARVLGDADPAVRAAAADALGGQARPTGAGAPGGGGHLDGVDAVGPLLGKLDDPSAPVKVQVVRSLARLGDARAVVPLVGKVQDSAPEVRREVARALGELADTRATQALLLSLRDERGEVRVEALSALGRMRASEATAAVAAYTQDRAPATRQAALSALGRIGTRDAVRALVASLGSADDPESDLERTPVRDALVAGGATTVAELRALLAGSPGRATAVSAAWVLGALGARSEAPLVVSAMRRGVLPVAAALRALAGCGTEHSVPVVLEFTADPSAEVRTEARRAALALLDPGRPDGRAVEPLAAALGDARLDATERAELATLLGRTGAARAAPLVAGLARGKERSVRLAALDALGTLGAQATAGGPAAEEALVEALGDPEPAVRLRAGIALGEVAGAGALAKLVLRLERGAELDRGAALVAVGGALARMASEPAAASLARALDVASGPERDALLEALARSRTQEASRALAAAARSDVDDDRRAVATALGGRAFDPAARVLAASLLGDPAPSVRAQAAWSLGGLASPKDRAVIDALIAHACGGDLDTAVNATAALARIAAGDAALAQRALCPRVAGSRAYVRANALAGLALASSRCGDGAAARQALDGDPSDEVRAAAALAIAATLRGPEDARLLDTCARVDRSARVAERCRDAATSAAARGTVAEARVDVTPRDGKGRAPRAVAVYVVPATSGAPQPGAPYALERPDGLLRAGVADRRGVVVEPAVSEGELALHRPAALAR